MRFVIALTALLFLGTAAAAEDHRMRLVRPSGTDLVLLKLVRNNDLYAKFAGQIWVAGTVIGRWPAGATNMNDEEPDFVLVPDQGSIARLPYFVLSEPPYLHRYKVRSITLLNGPEALRMGAGAEQVRKLLQRRVNSVRATGRFLIEQYAVGGECDAPWAKGVMVKAELPDQVARHQVVSDGC